MCPTATNARFRPRRLASRRYRIVSYVPWTWLADQAACTRMRFSQRSRCRRSSKRWCSVTRPRKASSQGGIFSHKRLRARSAVDAGTAWLEGVPGVLGVDFCSRGQRRADSLLGVLGAGRGRLFGVGEAVRPQLSGGLRARVKPSRLSSAEEAPAIRVGAAQPIFMVSGCHAAA